MTPEEFTRICIPLADGLYRTAYGLLGSAQEAEDAVQDLYLKLWSRREMLSEVRNIPAWIGVLLRKSGEPVLEIRVVGVDLHNGIGLVEVNLGEFLFLFQNGSLRKNQCFFG